MNSTAKGLLWGLGGLLAGYGIAYAIARGRGAPGAVSLINRRYYSLAMGSTVPGLPGQLTPTVNPLLGLGGLGATTPGLGAGLGTGLGGTTGLGATSVPGVTGF